MDYPADGQRIMVVGERLECGHDRCHAPAAVAVFQIADIDDNSGPVVYFCESHARELMGQLRDALFIQEHAAMEG